MPFRTIAGRTGLAASLIALCVSAAGAAELKGPASVVDGNSLEIGGVVVRLQYIDAPDEDQTCERGGAAWRCGQQASWALAEKIERHWVECDTGGSAADRPVGVCFMGERHEIDLGAWMVEQGWALSDRTGTAYVALEQQAQAAGRGLWSGKFDPPWAWRGRR
jgi:endonuclease YncB( thermonuclease family)